MSLQWSDTLEIGVEAIDAQHRELFRRFSDLIDACQEGRQQETIVELLRFLDDYTHFHFAEEEKLMAQSAYPGVQSHCKEHLAFIHRLQVLIQDLEARGPSPALVSHTTRILLNWIVRHIKQVDLELGTHLRQRTDRS